MSGRAALDRLFLVFLLAVSGACGDAAKSSPTPRATATASAVTVSRAILPSGAVYSIEIARTPEEQAQGLMFRESLPERTGMLFLFGGQGIQKFWMKNTMIPLDIIWLDGAGRVVFVSADTPPCKADPCPNYGPDLPAESVLEIAGGMAAKEKVTVGSRIDIHGVQR